ncbi:MAG TPA: hypothetical protein VJU79_09165, partial [Candidatus Dormibacteraeota bacterium]|nr:hypothetical protein [Candidatus Dormibacteraeota bacterium]
MPKVTDSVDVLRQGWNDAASSLAPDVAGLREALDEGLSGAERSGALNEQTLLAAIDEAMRRTGDAVSPEAGPALVRRLQRSVYEYLLSLDAVLPEESSSWADRPAHQEGAVLIGAEEVAALRGAEHHVPEAQAPALDTPALAPTPIEPDYGAPAELERAAPAEPEVAAGHEVAPEVEPQGPVAEEQTPLAAALQAAEEEAAELAPPEASTPTEPPEAVTPAEPETPGGTSPRRFAIFGRSSRQQVGYRV